MCLRIVPKADLTEGQLRYIEERVSAPEHVDDAGPPTVWNIYQHGLYAVIDGDSNTPVGINEQPRSKLRGIEHPSLNSFRGKPRGIEPEEIEASGPPESVAPGWWLDSRVRGKGLGNKMVDVLAEYLKKLGFTGVGNIPIQTRNQVYDKASSALVKRFRAHFGA